MSRLYLFNKMGDFLAFEEDGKLFSSTGEHIGDYLENEEIFINLNGRYLGEKIYENRLVYNEHSQHTDTIFGVIGYFGNIGSDYDSSELGEIDLPENYQDVDIN